MDYPETEEIFKIILERDLLLTNNNVSLLQKFISLWANAVPKETASSFLSKWCKNIFILHKQKNVNDATCLVTVLLLETLYKKTELCLDQIFISSTFTENVVPLHEIIASKYLINSIALTSSNDAVIAFFRLNYQISKNTKGSQLIKKYNLWKQLFRFFLENDKFNLFIQNSCTEYIYNLIASEFPCDSNVLLEVVAIIIHYIKSAIQDDNLCTRILVRSLRFLYLIFSKYLAQLDANSLHLISKKCHSLKDHLRLISMKSDDRILIGYSLKTYVLFKCFLERSENVEVDNGVFKQFVVAVQDLICETDKFGSYVPEIFNLNCGNPNCQILLQNCSSYLQIMTVLIYLNQLAVNVKSEESNRGILIPEEFKTFFQLYQLKLRSELRISDMVTCILKSIASGSEHLHIDTCIYLINSLNTILKSCENRTKKVTNELSDVIMNIIRAISGAISTRQELLGVQNIMREVLYTASLIARNSEYKIIMRLSALSLSCTVLRKIRNISNENVELLRHITTRGLDDQCWEIRDSVLELLNCTLASPFNVGDSDPVINDQRVSDAVVSALRDNESFVRASAYCVLITCVSSSSRHLWGKKFNYEKILSDTVNNFRNETENNVKQKMITFIHHAWYSYKISSLSLLTEIYQTMYQASCNDLYSEVRHGGMLFWNSLIQHITDNMDGRKKEESVKIIESLASVGCLQAVIAGIEDEYDFDVIITALNAVRSLQSFNLLPNDFFESTGDSTCTQLSESNLVQTCSLLENSLPNKLLIRGAMSTFTDAKTFVTNYCNIDLDKQIDDKRQEKGIAFSLKDLLECFADASSEESEINQKDCY